MKKVHVTVLIKKKRSVPHSRIWDYNCIYKEISCMALMYSIVQNIYSLHLLVWHQSRGILSSGLQNLLHIMLYTVSGLQCQKVTRVLNDLERYSSPKMYSTMPLHDMRFQIKADEAFCLDLSLWGYDKSDSSEEVRLVLTCCRRLRLSPFHMLPRAIWHYMFYK